jgi:hypothetical protein
MAIIMDDRPMARETLFSRIADEWHGEGRLLGRGCFSEVGWAFTTMMIGAWLILFPESVANVHILELIARSVPVWLVAPTLVMCGAFTGSGIVLFFIRGRCIASRIARLTGACLGLGIWLAILLNAVFVLRGDSAFVWVYTLGVLSFARAATLAWRRFL